MADAGAAERLGLRQLPDNVDGTFGTVLICTPAPLARPKKVIASSPDVRSAVGVALTVV